MKVHNIKLSIEFCDAVLNGEKTFEIRENDRGYQKGDHIRFKPVSLSPYQSFPYHAIEKREYEITYVLNGWGLKDGFVALAIKETERSET